MPTPPRFFYFDLGNVLLNFDHRRAARQMADVAGVTPQRVWEIVFASDLEIRYERGDISTQQFYEIFCEQSGRQPDFDALSRAGADIFELNVPMVPLVGQLKRAGHRLGVLSNTNEAHWLFVSDGRYTILNEFFRVYALSYQLRSIKPEPEVYAAAAELAETAPAEIFFVDDRPENVQAALQAGFDAILFEGPLKLAVALRSRGVRFDY